MSDHILHELLHSRELALKSSTLQEGLSQLTRAFSLFSEETQKLKSTHSKLQEELETVNEELAKLKEKSNRFETYLGHITTNVSEAVLFINLDGTISICNKAAIKLLKINGDPIRENFWDVFQDETFGFSMREALTFGITHRHVFRNDMEISASFIYEGPKKDHAMMLTLKDLTENQELKRVSNRNNRLKELGEMAATVAHEIRNPLGGIRGYASLLFRDLENSPNLQEMAGVIIEGTKNLEKIVSAILHYSKPIEIEFKTLDLGAFLKKLGKFIKVDPAFPTNVTLALHIPNHPFLVPFDERALKSAMLNLIFNAFQAMKNGGELTISLLKLESSCQISVTDTGIGILEEQLDLLFSPFYTTKKRGNGLGLVETQKIVQAHYGRIETRSKPNIGTTFTIILPIRT